MSPAVFGLACMQMMFLVSGVLTTCMLGRAGMKSHEGSAGRKPGEMEDVLGCRLLLVKLTVKRHGQQNAGFKDFVLKCSDLASNRSTVLLNIYQSVSGRRIISLIFHL